ncbi:MAG TPA: multiheme c-type cytochrome [Silvibacterium sp.]|nr:multiheme c-type cytochrome [Silvibacterium sp.]
MFLMVLGASSLPAQLSTEDHLAEPGFWPTQAGVSRNDYVGPAACAACHRAKVAAQEATPMARAVSHADDAKVLRTHPDLTFSVGPYRYLIKSDGRHSLYTVTNGTETLSSPLLWAFGTPRVGQSYLFKRDDGRFYEARVTYFESLNNLGFTPARDLASPKDVEEAMDRPVGPTEVSRCFGCHTTASTIGDKFDEENLILGVTCEACHGPGAKHVAAMKTFMKGNLDAANQGDIFNSAHLDPIDSVEFCGACHATLWDVKISGGKGVATTRSAPYRLVTSKCWGKGDARLTCIACHDPHEQLQTNSAAYDHACLKCHAAAPGLKPAADHPGAACPVGTKNCTSCHMQEVYVPEMHSNFTDHRIRIVRQGEPFPE